MKKILISILAVIMIQPMSFAIGTKSTMGKIMDSWLGEHINTVMDSWGYPSQEKEIAGRKLYYWINSSYVVSGGQYGVYGVEYAERSVCHSGVPDVSELFPRTGVWKGLLERAGQDSRPVVETTYDRQDDNRLF